MATRSEQREKTRQAIIQAALSLSSERGLPSLSLREVTREAGVAPATFYRYFTDMEELQLTLVDQAGLKLRQLMRQARTRVRIEGSLVTTSIETYMQFLEQNSELFRLLMGDLTGGPRALRQEIFKEKQRFVDELAIDLASDGQTIALPEHFPIISEMMVNLVFQGGVEALDLPKNDRKRLERKLEIQLNVILAGSFVFATQDES
ncbi:DNA-binding transcriptional regulator FabR [Gammaproteobacteria bacterium 45_16_T64]|nr:DNA-binding transcriptional regulator FabR [Gammaproteobacteria bacterium 45_16_T64]